MGAIGLDYPAVYKVAESLEIEMDGPMLRKIATLERSVLASRAQSGETPPPPIDEYCSKCADSKRNIDCHECDLTLIQSVKHEPEKP